MCGIVGLATAKTNGLTWAEANMFKTMLFLDQLRGMDSTGCFSVHNNGNVFALKEASHAVDFLKNKEYSDWHDANVRKGQFVVGHNRAATRGTVKDENAHPFWVDDKILLVQNGTYKGDHKHLKDTEVDTHAVAHVIAEEDDVEKALQRINAAYALVWYNVEKQSLNIIRNDERPLLVAYTKDGSMVFASEYEFILFASHRHNVELKGKPYELAPYNLHTLTLDKTNGWVADNKKLDARYRFQNEYKHHSQAWRAACAASGYDEEDVANAPWWNKPADQWGEHLHAARKQTQSTQIIEKTMHHYVHQGKFNEFTDYEDIINELLEEEEKRKAAKSWTNVEFFDYYPCNEREDCNTFIIVGRDINAGDTHPSLVYHYTMHNTNEQSVYALITNSNIAKCYVSTCVKQRVGGNPSDYIGTALVQSYLLIDTEKLEAYVH